MPGRFTIIRTVKPPFGSGTAGWIRYSCPSIVALLMDAEDFEYVVRVAPGSYIVKGAIKYKGAMLRVGYTI